MGEIKERVCHEQGLFAIDISLALFAIKQYLLHRRSFENGSYTDIKNYMTEQQIMALPDEKLYYYF